jgi:hypothetical protein
VQDLQRDLAAFFVNRLRKPPMIAQIEYRVQRAAERQQPSFAIRRDAAGDDEADAALRALAEVLGQLRIIPEAIFHARMHGPHHDAIAQAGKAEVEFRE